MDTKMKAMKLVMLFHWGTFALLTLALLSCITGYTDGILFSGFAAVTESIWASIIARKI